MQIAEGISSQHDSFSQTESALESAPLTQKNLEKLSLAPELNVLSSTASTYCQPAHDERCKECLGDPPLPHQRTPSPLPPSDTAVLKVPEKPRPVKTTRNPHQPHQCALGIACLLEINNLNYHRQMATHLVAKARRVGLPIPPIDTDRDYSDLESLKRLSKQAANLLEERYQRGLKNHITCAASLGWETDSSSFEELNPWEALKGIQSHEHWETEMRYLKSPGCLAKRQKPSASVSSSCQSTSRVLRSQTRLGSTSLSSSANAEYHGHPNTADSALVKQPLQMAKSSIATLDASRQPQVQVPAVPVTKKRKSVEDAVVKDDIGRKRRKTGSIRYLMLGNV